MKSKNFLLAIVPVLVLLFSSCEEADKFSDDAIIRSCIKTDPEGYHIEEDNKYLVVLELYSQNRYYDMVQYYTNKNLCQYVGLTYGEAMSRWYAEYYRKPYRDEQTYKDGLPHNQNSTTNQINIYNNPPNSKDTASD